MALKIKIKKKENKLRKPNKFEKVNKSYVNYFCSSFWQKLNLKKKNQTKKKKEYMLN